MVTYLAPFSYTLVEISGIVLESNCQNTKQLFPSLGVGTVCVLMLLCHVLRFSGPLTRRWN